MLRPSSEIFLKRIWALTFGALFLLQFGSLGLNAVNLPIADEWEFWLPRSPLFSWDWFLAFHNEHRIVLSKLFYYGNYKLFGLDYRIAALENFLLYGVFLFSFGLVLRRARFEATWIFPFFLFLLSDLAATNIAWPFQSCFTLLLILFFVALYFFSDPKETTSSTLRGAAVLALCPWSLAAGVVFALAPLVLFACDLVRDKKDSAVRKRFLLSCALVLPSLLLWAHSYPRQSSPVPHTYPWNLRFWSYIGHYFSGILGIEITGDLWVLVSYGLFFSVAFFGFRKYWSEKSSEERIRLRLALTVFVALFASAAITAFGRAGFGVAQAKADRYLQFCLPLTVLLPWLLTRVATDKWRVPALALFWLACFGGFLNNWNYPARYEKFFEVHRRGLSCLMKNPEGLCPELYPVPLKDRIEQARKMGASFTQSPELRASAQ